ncbi:MAG: RdgB/HAM1 family non-canonical purine NTP pyrophosphatase [Calditrichae bacterium]|nr:RdgB/HAM1 family non-canonical purine NTP pyrophosphatase [Calditrichota bacterium]MCB9059679.1 RdgB/HAM1 family non-canonical purine NTP pyrophosphatase [Calditrichia bacterium]
MFNIVFASTNHGKIREFSYQLNIPHIQFLTLDKVLLPPLPKIEETGSTFIENALLKARGYYHYIKQPIIADDSGLVVPSLNGEPGVYSARYAGINATDSQNTDLLLLNMQDMIAEKRDAFFQISLVYKDESGEMVFDGRCYGKILDRPQGANGFGYDPVFYIPEFNKTMAELTLEEKSKISHRGRAVNELKKFLKNVSNNPDF